MNISRQVRIIEGGGGVFNVNGEPSNAAELGLALAGLDASDQSMLQSELQDIIDQMKWRSIPLQYWPKGEGPAPTVDLRVPGNHGQQWSLGAKWDRQEP